MMTKEEAMLRLHYISELKRRSNFDKSKVHLYRWSIGANPAKKELEIHPYSSIVCDFGFETKREAEEFMKDGYNLKLLKDTYL